MSVLRAKLASPWVTVSPEAARSLEDELARELSLGHALYGMRVAAIARRTDRDDVLFELRDSPPKCAVVHLTYQPESSPEWPIARIFESIDAWSGSGETEEQP